MTDRNNENIDAKDVEETDGYELPYLSADGKTLTKFDIWERKLLDFTLRNTLLNISLRRRALHFAPTDIAALQKTVQNGERFRIVPLPEPEPDTTSDEKPMAETNADVNIMPETETIALPEDTPEKEEAASIERHQLQAVIPKDEMKAVLKNIFRTSRNAIEETGVNTLFLALGTLKWHETDRAHKPRYAPLLLIPVEMTEKKGIYSFRIRDEEPAVNVTLLEFLRQNYGINIPESDLEHTDGDESDFDITHILEVFRKAVKEEERWSVEEECTLGIFSFSKFLMWNDIRTHRVEMTGNPVISSLLANRLTWTPTHLEGNMSNLDKFVSPDKIALPVDADSSQMAAVVAAGSGESLIIYGPPGTGKSQTITNIIANALYHGRRVLFVSEKMAALSVVQKRLKEIGIDPFCLELHSKKSTKRHVLKQLEKAMKARQLPSATDFSKVAESTFKKRKELIDFIEALHKTHEADGMSLYDSINRSEAITATPLPGFSYSKSIEAFLKKEGMRGVEELLHYRLIATLGLSGQPSRHPLRGLHVDAEMILDSEETAVALAAERQTLESYLQDISKLSAAKGLRRCIQIQYGESILSEDPYALKRQWEETGSKWVIPRYFARKALHKRLKAYIPLLPAADTETVIDRLVEYRDLHDRIEAGNAILRNRFGMEYGEDKVASRGLIKEKIEDIERWTRHLDRMSDWIHWVNLSDMLHAGGMASVAEAFEKEELDPSGIKDSFLKALYIHYAGYKAAASEELRFFEGVLFELKEDNYRRLADELQKLTRKELFSRLAKGVPRMTDPGFGSEIGFLNRTISSGGRGVSMRELFDRLPNVLPRLCPGMLMSPMSVAKYLDVKPDMFDMVIFDEASQVPTSEAIGAIARGKALVVVGDPKQMPPTIFFNSNNVDEDEAPIDDMESILEDCRTLDMPSLQLTWHYRSRHESLIAFSNEEYYDGSLITFPSVDDKDSKVHYVHVTGGYYEKGGRRCNVAEAEAIVDEIVRRLRSKELRRLSIGVIAFSVMQQGLIEDCLQERLDRSKILSMYVDEMPEPIFIKNLENAQGDERDVILFSIGYGPDREGNVSMNFGPLNNAGGERRLNVAVSRARQEMYVFSTLKSTDIDLQRSKAKGVEGLRHFLEYAETQSLKYTNESVTGDRRSWIAERIAEKLRELGYAATTDVGRSQFRVDVAVERKDRPGMYALAILLDGEGYRDTPTMRDREIVQPSVLQGLGWSVMRVHALDWFNNRERVIQRILKRLSCKL